jgi:tetratricopeptide (TPR) repeat protein
MKKTLITILAAVGSVAFVKAQTLQDGINNLYAKRNKSAKSIFEKMLATNPNSIDANYWLGQTHLAMENIAGAKGVFEKALMNNGNAPLLLVGMGQVELWENKTNDARQRFETAISISKTKKGDDANVLNAIGLANVDAKAGDVAYAVEKLKAAVEKEPRNATFLINMGDAYKKAVDGSNAFVNYTAALSANPSFAFANYRIAKLFETQKNWESFLEYLNKAATVDPKFAPAYFEMFYYYLQRKQFTEAEANLTKYIANTDADPQNDYWYASLCWLKKDFDCAISKANTVIANAGADVKARVYKLLAYSYFDKGDYSTARQNINIYFAKEKPEEVVSADYKLLADILTKSGGSDAELLNSYVKGSSTIEAEAEKIQFLKEGQNFFKATGKNSNAADLGLVINKSRKTPFPYELFDIGLLFYKDSAYTRADSSFKAYSAALPDSIYGYFWSARALASIDTTMIMGSAVPPYQKTLDIAGLDKVRYKSYGLESGRYLGGYSYRIKKDKAATLAYFKKALEFDTANASLRQNINSIQAQPAPKQTPPAKTPAGTKTGTGAKPVATKPPAAKNPLKKNNS